MVWVTIARTPSTLRVVVRDDGAGGADEAQGSGLLGLRDRVSVHNGRMTVTSPQSARATLEDWSSAVDFARSQPDVDPSRVVLWGTSFAAGHVLVTASRRDDVAAVIAQCPFIDGRAGLLSVDPRVAVKLNLLAVRDHIGARLGRPPVLVPAAGAPRTASMMTAPDALPGLQATKGEIHLYHDGHFDIYAGEAFERVVNDQLTFLTKHIPNALTPARQ